MADVSVRPARQTDADALSALQVAAWRSAYADVLPETVLDGLLDQRETFAAAWAEATVRPPTYRHRVLVACQAGDAGDDTVVGGATMGPGEDDDADPGTAAEIFTFVVAPAHRRQGHGSRLLSASVDFLRGAGFTRAAIWLDSADLAAQGLFAASGWAADSSTRQLDLDGDGSVVIDQLRLHTDLLEGLGS
jgi:ribosomal protein S18 acetylase RimI-like enzyme